jgi:hypothetical protein
LPPPSTPASRCPSLSMPACLPACLPPSATAASRRLPPPAAGRRPLPVAARCRSPPAAGRRPPPHCSPPPIACTLPTVRRCSHAAATVRLDWLFPDRPNHPRQSLRNRLQATTRLGRPAVASLYPSLGARLFGGARSTLHQTETRCCGQRRPDHVENEESRCGYPGENL